MQFASESVEILIEQFSKLPTIGRKSAQRLAAHILKMPKEDVARLANALLEMKERVRACDICGNVTDAEICIICNSTKRESGIVCVVQDAEDIVALERTGEYRGRYHVLGGVISPLDGIGPDDLNIRTLIERVGTSDSDITELILAVSPTVEGDTTALYLTQLLEPFPIKITRLARGIPVGLTLSYADEATLSRAIAGRNTISKPREE
ncbi:MAG: recombination protein RecR [Rhodothermaceae bacterium]|nr:recombination protein RecR [Rhodothermaceae bacterium]MXZ57121.1 recombination protein RecR [Rhodothermaceae bacterium]MYB90819.1 recombination protein RecR [Rhodothermaceae bacterium]MYD68805.1 recombination protein RecR [Rhodothermaceae bacterium]MYG44988.1 recombination protein RecR [Rhodothermaceae bacterium]